MFGQDVDTVCRIWRDPPLKTSTVLGYIAESIRVDGLPFEKARFEREILEQMEEFQRGKYRGVAKRGYVKAEEPEKEPEKGFEENKTEGDEGNVESVAGNEKIRDAVEDIGNDIGGDANYDDIEQRVEMDGDMDMDDDGGYPTISNEEEFEEWRRSQLP